jgi:hypothetical protein
MRLPIQYATLKIIEQSDDITADGVLRYVYRARELANLAVEINVQAIVKELMAELLDEKLSPADQFLVQALIQQIDYEITNLRLVRPESTLTILDVLVWVEQAAIMSGGRP